MIASNWAHSEAVCVCPFSLLIFDRVSYTVFITKQITHYARVLVSTFVSLSKTKNYLKGRFFWKMIFYVIINGIYELYDFLFVSKKYKSLCLLVSLHFHYFVYFSWVANYIYHFFSVAPK